MYERFIARQPIFDQRQRVFAEWKPLLALARFLKVDFRLANAEARSDLAKRFLPQGFHLVAEKVEPQAEFDQARGMGYTFFQGYFFCRPTVVE